MLAEDRLNTIVSMVQQAGSVTVPELADALGVTASTIRRDLQTLDRAHRIAKVHGGATSLERAHVTRDLTISERSDLHNDDKERICARAAALVEPESFVVLFRIVQIFGEAVPAGFFSRLEMCDHAATHQKPFPQFVNIHQFLIIRCMQLVGQLRQPCDLVIGNVQFLFVEPVIGADTAGIGVHDGLHCIFQLFRI